LLDYCPITQYLAVLCLTKFLPGNKAWDQGTDSKLYAIASEGIRQDKDA